MRIDAIAIGKNPPEDVNVIIEVSVGGHPIKYEMDKEAGTLVVDRFLYTPMTYPGNYGFVPHTLSDDGDPIDVLVCNAATNPVYGTTAEMTDEAWDKIMDTNVKGTFWLTNMVLPQMAEKGEGAVVLLSSIAGIRGNTTIGTYGVSKAAEAALARNLAVEWGPKGIRVNSIAPGLIKTDFARALWEDPVRVKRAEDKTPLRRIGDPVDIAGLAVFLSTKASAYVTGQVIVADGGETIC